MSNGPYAGAVPADLVLAFPPTVRAAAAHVVAALPPADHAPMGSVTSTSHRQWPGLVVGGAAVTIPQRLDNPPPHDGFGTGRPGVIAACLYTRHHDGYVRHDALRAVLPSAEPWVAPFVVQLLGEYVLEIVLDIAEFVHTGVYAKFVSANPAFIELTTQRATSYWAEYHRGRYPSRDAYPALAALRALAGQ